MLIKIIIKKHFDLNPCDPIELKQQIQYRMSYFKIGKLPKTNKLIYEIMKYGNDVTIKINMKVMITEKY